MSGVDGGQRRADVGDASSEADNTSTGILQHERNRLAPSVCPRYHSA